jgi:hypothetical protein
MVTISLPIDQRALFCKRRDVPEGAIGGISWVSVEDHFRIVDFSRRQPERLPTSAALTIARKRWKASFEGPDLISDASTTSANGTYPSFPVRPSRGDIMSMQSLVDGERTSTFRLVIVRLRYFFLLEAAAYMFVRHSGAGRVALTA